MVFLWIVDWECVRRGRRSERTESAREGVMMCGSVIIGRDMVVEDVEVKSYMVVNLHPFYIPFSEYVPFSAGL